MNRIRWNARVGAALAVAILLGLAAPGDLQAAAEGTREGQRLDLNKATPAELAGVPGIGETLAKRIVAFRDEHGPFRRVDDLMKVKGIGEKSFEKIRPFVKVSKSK